MAFKLFSTNIFSWRVTSLSTCCPNPDIDKLSQHFNLQQQPKVWLSWNCTLYILKNALTHKVWVSDSGLAPLSCQRLGTKYSFVWVLWNALVWRHAHSILRCRYRRRNSGQPSHFQWKKKYQHFHSRFSADLRMFVFASHPRPQRYGQMTHLFFQGNPPVSSHYITLVVGEHTSELF